MAKPGVSIKIKGGKELEKTLLQLSKQYGPRNIRTAVNAPLKEAIKPVEADIRSNTPVDTGNLKNSIGTKLGRGKLPKGGGNSRGVSKGGVGANIFAAIRTGWMNINFRKAVAVEYGTTKKPATNVISNALERNASGVLSIFFNGVSKSIEKAVNRLSKRKKLGKLKFR